MRLNCFPGRRVVEAGTGSGGLTLALARSVMPTGRVYSYDERSRMLDMARRNLQRSGLLPYVELRERDVRQGFDEQQADACFLDLREPWDCLAQVRAALKPGGFFGSILPTTNQVSDLLEALERHGFVEIIVEELLLRSYKPVPQRLRPVDRMVAHTGYLVFARVIEPSDAEAWSYRDPKHGKRPSARSADPAGGQETQQAELSGDG